MTGPTPGVGQDDAGLRRALALRGRDSARVAAFEREVTAYLQAVDAEVAQARPTSPVVVDLVHTARNILWSAENGGHNGRPSEVRRILRELLDALES